MKGVKYLILFSIAALMLSVAAAARDNNEHTIAIPDSVRVGNVHLMAGNYRVEWNQPGPQVQVAFLRHGKTVATAPATLKTNDKQVTEDDVVTRKTAANVRVLQEIDLGHQKEALLFSKRGA